MSINAVMFTPNFSLGGAERWIVSLIANSDPARLRWAGVVASGWGGCDRRLAAAVSQHTKLIGHVPTERPIDWPTYDLMHCDRTHDCLVAAIRDAAKDADVLVTWGVPNCEYHLGDLEIPRVCVSHTTDKTMAGPVTGITHLVGVSEAAADYFRVCDGHAELPLDVLYNGAEFSRDTDPADLRSMWGLADDGIAVGYVGRQSPEKNFTAAARAVSLLPEQFSAIYYGEAAGSAAPHAKLVEYQQQLGRRLALYAPTDNVSAVYANLDVLVLASHREAFSLVLLEAWLAGVPVVATRVGSVPELEAKYGKLVISVPTNASAAVLAAAVQRAASAEGQEIAARAKRVAQAEFTAEAMSERWATYLQRVCREYRG